MKSKLLKTLKIGILILGIFLFTISCEKETIEEQIIIEQQEPTPKLTFKHVFKDELNKNNTLNNKISDLNKKIADKKSKGVSSKNVYNKEYNFIIDTNSATYIENEDTHSYTFPIVQDINDNLTNVLFTLNEQNGYDAYLVKYGFSFNQLGSLDAKQLSKRTKITPINIDFNSLAGKLIPIVQVFYEWSEVDVDGWANGSGGNLVGADCDTCTNTIWVITGVRYSVTYIDVGGDDPGSPSDSNSGPGGGGSNSGGFNTTPTFSFLDPVDIAKIETVKEQLSLSLPERLWIDKSENAGTALKIHDFLDANNWNPQAKEFAESAIEALINGGEVDFDLEIVFEITETIEFQNQTCLKSIKDEVVKTKQISRIIKKFEPTHPVLHLEWGMFGNTNWGNTGQTSLNEEQNTAFININRESLSHVSNIVMVKTIAHEIIHAELYRKLKELVDDYRIITLSEYIALQNNYLGIADYTFRYGELEYSQNIAGQLVTWGLTPNFSEAHHNQMADFYRGTLIEVMKAYDVSKNITRTNASEFYEALSWAGLRAFSDENDNIQYYDAWKKFKEKIDNDESTVPIANRTYNRYINIANQEYNNTGIKCN